MELIRERSWLQDILAFSRYSLFFCADSSFCIRVSIPDMPFKGVRISCDTFDRNLVLASVATLARSRARLSSFSLRSLSASVSCMLFCRTRDIKTTAIQDRINTITARRAADMEITCFLKKAVKVTDAFVCSVIMRW